MATKRKRRTVGKRRTHRTAVIKVGRRRRRSVGAVGKTHHRRRREQAHPANARHRDDHPDAKRASAFFFGDPIRQNLSG